MREECKLIKKFTKFKTYKKGGIVEVVTMEKPMSVQQALRNFGSVGVIGIE